MSRQAQRRKERVSQGLCPRCGKDAAPYYLCPECRFKGKLDRILNAGNRRDIFKKEKRGRSNWWAPGEKINTTRDWYREVPEGDARLLPRIRSIPVDVEAQLVKIFEDEGRPLSMEEVMAAWGSLRVREGRASAAADLAKIIRAQRKRERKAEKISAENGDKHAVE